MNERMAGLDGITEYMSIVLHFIVAAMLLCGTMVWMQRQENERQRVWLSVTFVLGGLLMFFRLLLTYAQGIPPAYPVLPIANLYGGLFALLLLFFYPIEVVAPGWLNLKKTGVLFLPMVVVTVVLAVVRFDFVQLDSWADLQEHIGEPNVWFRLGILFVAIVPYSILLLFVPYNWKKSSIDAKWIRIYAVGVQGIGVLYTLFMLTGSILVSAIHLSYCLLFFLYVVYQELFLRLFPTSDVVNVAPDVSVPVPVSQEKTLDEQQLWDKLTAYMYEQEPWRSPDVTIGEVAKAIGTNRTTLSAEIHRKGGTAFYDLIADYRIRAFCEMIGRGAVDNINEAFFEVGFRSRTTAYKRFKIYTGKTPTEYIKTIKSQPK